LISRNTVSNLIISIVVISIAAGCTTLRSLPATDAQSIASQLEVGDKVRITRHDATDAKFRIDTISSEGIGGDGVFVAYSDIQTVQVREHSTAKTVGLVAAILIILKAWVDYANAAASLYGGS
jgi:hypothetical protein